MEKANEYIKIRVEDFEQSQDKMFEDLIYHQAAGNRMEIMILSAVNMLEFLSRAAGRDDYYEDDLVLGSGEKAVFLKLLEQTRQNLEASVEGVERKVVKAAIEDFKGKMPGQTE